MPQDTHLIPQLLTKPTPSIPATAPAITQDNHRAEIAANIGGLLRAKFLFRDHNNAPTERQNRPGGVQSPINPVGQKLQFRARKGVVPTAVG